ncbi:MAG TPA: cell division ATP-binding protein FtsE [Stenotrophobium sp.]|jgi:cell division transport system ATP-binding protein|nr:cell division ATP-binding protein FtsE [Stenotrophobium sp.]
MSNIIEFQRVSHRYAGGQDVLSDIEFSLAQGEMAFLTGASGAGKSTILRLVARLARATRGLVMVDGQNLATLKPRQVPAFRQRLGLIFQNVNLLNDRTVFDNVALPLVIRGFAHRDLGRQVRAALDQVGLLNKERLYPLFLSGGEQQRVGIARAVVTKPDLLLADEPTGNLDPELAQDVMKIFERFNGVGVSVLVATHAIDLINKLPHRVVHLENGRISDHAPTAASTLGGFAHGA